jgi:hypothetical protein
MSVTTPKPRATLTGGPEGLEIVIPAQRNLVVLVFLGIWLVGWVTGEVTTLAELLMDGPRRSEGVVLLWLALWTLGGVFAGYMWLWMLVGKERILMGTSALRVKRDVLGLGPAHTYQLFRVRNLRVATRPVGPRDTVVTPRLARLVGGLIAFEHEGQTVRFGASIDEAEARMIVERMRQRYAFPELPSPQQPGSE